MLVLLPPSEGKLSPASGPALETAALSFPSLNPTREAILGALVSACSADAAHALRLLGLSPGQAGLVTANAALPDAPCAPAIEVYSGVLYDALDARSLRAAARRRLGTRVAIASALWGLLRPGDPIPAYRLSGDPDLPSIGRLRSAWRVPLQQAIREAAGPGLVVDLRSSAYVALGPVPSDLAGQLVAGSVSHLRGGRRVSVSHHNKATKGRLVRDLVSSSRAPAGPQDLADLCRDLGYDVTLSKARGGWALDVLMAE